MDMEMILTAIVSVIGGGGLAAIIQAIANKKKSKSEVTDINVKTAIELEKVAMARYTDISRHLEALDTSLIEAREKVTAYWGYIIVLQDLLKNNGIDFPKLEV